MCDLVGNEEGVFEVDDVTGILTTEAVLDYEERTEYILTVQAMDSAGVNSQSSITQVYPLHMYICILHMYTCILAVYSISYTCTLVY